MPFDKREAALVLADEVLTNIELGDITLGAAMLKCARLARLLGDEPKRQIFTYEAGGYPSGPNGISGDIFELGRVAGRVYEEKSKEGESVEKMRTSSVSALEQAVDANRVALVAAADRNVSVSSANPNQTVFTPSGNTIERQRLVAAINTNSALLAKSRSFAYDYVSSAQYELELSKAANGVFENASARIDTLLIKIAPEAARKTVSINENLESDNAEDWANAVHGCRRLLQSVADALFPPRDPIVRNNRTIKLGVDNYINRLMVFVEDQSKSSMFISIVGSSLSYMGERLDALFHAAQKGSHAEISSRAEAERYVIYTYMIVGDILTLTD